MKEYIERKLIYNKIAELESLARDRYLETPTTSPLYPRYMAQLDERTKLKFLIMDEPAADVVERARGEWVYVNGFAACSRCGASPAYHEPKPKNEQGFPPFCFECGADMRKDEA